MYLYETTAWINFYSDQNIHEIEVQLSVLL